METNYLTYRDLRVVVEEPHPTHFPYQIFFPSFWLDQSDTPPAEHTIISTDDIRNGVVRPNPAVAWWLCNASRHFLGQRCRLGHRHPEPAARRRYPRAAASSRW